MKELRVEVPQGYEIDKENSSFECIKFKPIKDIKTTEDLIETHRRVSGYWINEDAKVRKENSLYYLEHNKNVFFSEKEVKSALAMAQISQLMPYYGGAITDEEWESKDISKIYTIERIGNKVFRRISHFNMYQYLAFRTKEQRDSFLNNNYRLVKDYLMLD